MKLFIACCLIGAVFTNPISYSTVLVSSELDSNSTESMSVSRSSENSTSGLQSSEENSSSQSLSSESDSSESTSEETSEESNGLSDENDEILAETSDNSMASEENIRKSWVQVFPSVVKDLSAEDNSSSAEVKGQSELHLTENQPTHRPSASTTVRLTQGKIRNLQLVKNPSESSESSSDSSDVTNPAATGVAPIDSESSESSSSESGETNESSDSSDASKSAEEGNASESAELEQVKTTQDCVNGTQSSCESEEYFFQDIGDDAHYSAVDNLMVPDEDERELSLRR